MLAKYCQESSWQWQTCRFWLWSFALGLGFIYSFSFFLTFLGNLFWRRAVFSQDREPFQQRSFRRSHLKSIDSKRKWEIAKVKHSHTWLARKQRRDMHGNKIIERLAAHYLDLLVKCRYMTDRLLWLWSTQEIVIECEKVSHCFVINGTSGVAFKVAILLTSSVNCLCNLYCQFTVVKQTPTCEGKV